MGRYNVEHNGKWAAFSTITDSFVTAFMDKKQYEAWRKVEYGVAYKPVKDWTVRSLKEAVSDIRLNRSHDEALKCLLETGLPKDECEAALHEMELEYYHPVPAGDGKYECPNCCAVVVKGQKQCEEITCGLEFVWE